MTRSLPMIPDAELLRTTTPPGAGDEPGFGALSTERGKLPLEALDVRGRIDGLLARVVVRQTFVNAFDVPLEAAYIFPLPDRAAVTAFRMMVAGREVQGVLEERGKARENYDKAIAEGRRASIAEEDRPGVFNLRVGNLMPGERATVELTLCGVLPYADGEATFRFPLVVAPRYIPGTPLPGPSVGGGTALDTNAVPDASRISPPVLLPGFPNPVRLSLEVELHDGGVGAEGVRSSLHAVQEETKDHYLRLRVQPGERLDRDFILRYRLGGDNIRSTLTLHPDAIDQGYGTFALTIVPPAASHGAPARPRDVVFVLDRSGSMEGWKMVAARRALARMIDTLVEADRFSVLAFDSTVETPGTLPEGLATAGDRNRFRAVEFLATVDARGGTEMAQPLDRAVKLLASGTVDDRDRILVLITDGQVGQEDQVLSMLGDRLRRIRVFTIGIDQAVNEGFLRRLADRGGGWCELVESEDRLDEVMDAIHRRIGTPLLAGLSLDPRELSIEPGEVVPRRFPDLFPGSPLLILGRYSGRLAGQIEFSGTDASGKPHRESIAAAVRENPAIAAAWARGQIRQLEDRFAAHDGDRARLEKAIIEISLRFQVLCRFTAYVAVDRSEVVNQGGTVHPITQPVELPAGWAEFAPGTRASLASARPMMKQRRSGPPGGGGARRVSGRSDRALPPSAPMPPAHESLDSFLFLEDHSVCSAPSPAPFAVPSPVPVAGKTLAESLRCEGPMVPRKAAELMSELAMELHLLHGKGFVHQIITPTTIELDSSGQAHLTGRSWAMNSPLDQGTTLAEGISCYTPPEWLNGEVDTFDPRGNVYSLGVILYLLLTGRPPFGDGQGVEVMVREILGGLPKPPRRLKRSIPAELEAICLKAMARDPSARYTTAQEFAEALIGFLKPQRKAFWK